MSPHSGTGGYVPVIHGAIAGRPDEADTVLAARAVQASLVLLGYRSDIIHLGLDLSGLAVLARQRPVAVFNLVEALAGDAALAQLVPPVLDYLGLAYTGARSDAWRRTLSKTMAKQLMAGAGLPTPQWTFGSPLAGDCQKVIVKSDTEHASVGIDDGSVVPAGDAAREIAARQARFGGTFFAEAFIPGREFNMAVIGAHEAPRLLPAAEILFDGVQKGKPGIVGYDAKWDEASDAWRETPRRLDFDASDGPLLARLGALTLQLWHTFGLSGYARADFRVDEAGRPFILEVNVNPCLTPDAGFFAAAGHGGLSYDAMIGLILDAARAVPAQAV